jgi:hypothetical protein
MKKILYGALGALLICSVAEAGFWDFLYPKKVLTIDQKKTVTAALGELFSTVMREEAEGAEVADFEAALKTLPGLPKEALIAYLVQENKINEVLDALTKVSFLAEKTAFKTPKMGDLITAISKIRTELKDKIAQAIKDTKKATDWKAFNAAVEGLNKIDFDSLSKILGDEGKFAILEASGRLHKKGVMDELSKDSIDVINKIQLIPDFLKKYSKHTEKIIQEQEEMAKLVPQALANLSASLEQLTPKKK